MSTARVGDSAALLGDCDAMCGHLSRAAVGVVRASAKAEGGPADNCEAALAFLIERGSYPRPPGASEFDVAVASVAGDLAAVAITALPVDEFLTVPFIFEDGAWKVGVAGLHDSTS